MQQREGYWDYMGRRLREDRTGNEICVDDLWKREIQEMQSAIHTLQIRVKTLNEIIHQLEYKVNILGGNPNQLELEL